MAPGKSNHRDASARLTDRGHDQHAVVIRREHGLTQPDSIVVAYDSASIRDHLQPLKWLCKTEVFAARHHAASDL